MLAPLAGLVAGKQDGNETVIVEVEADNVTSMSAVGLVDLRVTTMVSASSFFRREKDRLNKFRIIFTSIRCVSY